MLTDELISRRPSGRTGLADWYAALFQAQRAEGLSAAKLAARLHVTPTNIYYWKRRLRELGHEGPSTAEPGGEVRTAASELVRVAVRPGTEDSSAALAEVKDLEVRLPNHRSILVPRKFDPAALRELVATLESC